MLFLLGVVVVLLLFSLNNKLLLISSSLSPILLSSFKIISFLILLGSNLFLDLVTILPTLEKVASEGVEVVKIAK